MNEWPLFLRRVIPDSWGEPEQNETTQLYSTVQYSTAPRDGRADVSPWPALQEELARVGSVSSLIHHYLTQRKAPLNASIFRDLIGAIPALGLTCIQ